MRLPLLAALAAVLLLALLPAGSPADPAPQATAAKKCGLTSKQQRHLGATYVLTVRVSGTTCANGRKVVKAYHQCRFRNGGRDGKCGSKVFGYKCSERRFNKIPSQYDARARCKKSGREIFQVYTQNT
jgi:hypothetical protein